MNTHRNICTACNHVYEEPEQNPDGDIPFSELPEDWKCPACGAGKSSYRLEQPRLSQDGLQRHPSLKALSRDHGLELVCVQGLQKALKATRDERLRIAEDLRAVCREALLSYLEDEHRILSPVVPPDLIEEFAMRHNHVHEMVRQLTAIGPSVDPGLGLFSRIADALDDHVRWQERMLFPAIELTAGSDELSRIREKTDLMECGRARPTQRLHSSVSRDKLVWLALGNLPPSSH